MGRPSEPDDTADSQHFGDLLRQWRRERGWSLRDLGERISFHRGYVGRVEQGERFPDRQFAELADRAFAAHGTLISAWRAEAEERHRSERVGRLVTASVKDSLRLIASVDEHLAVEEIRTGVDRLAIDYLSTPPGPMLKAAVELRSEILRRLREHHYRPSELADLHLAMGRLQGVLTYAALDLGDAQVAMIHADAALACCDRLGDGDLRSWVRGTQSLIARFTGEYRNALEYAQNGLYHNAHGTGQIRLLCGVAQCRANLGDSLGTNAALNLAQDARDRLSTAESPGGLFGFPTAKQHYYAGSSLIWLDGGKDAERAVCEAAQAIAEWEQEPPESRPLDDEALARVYRATAHLQLGELEAAAIAIRPVLDLPADRQISWIRKRIDRLTSMLRTGPYRGSGTAGDLHDEIRSRVGPSSCMTDR